MAEGVDESRYRLNCPQQSLHPSQTTNNVPSTPESPQTESWTPFSGMPASPVSAAGIFAWDTPTLNTSTPTSSFNNNQIPNFFTNYSNYGLNNIVNRPSDESRFILNTNLSNSSPPPVVNSPFPPHTENLELYAEAIKQYQQETGGSGVDYSHFNTPSPIVPVNIINQQTSKPAVSLESNIKNDKFDSSKPTYSDIAKTMKTKSMQKDNQVPLSRSPTEGLGKPPKSYTKRSSSSRTHSSRAHPNDLDGNFGSVVSPDSKYGLDQFEEVDSGSRSDRSSILGGSNESLSYRSRQGSTSSLSSGTSVGMEDIHLTKSFGLPSFHSVETRQEMETDKKTSTASTTKKEKKFFDPRRIFQTPEVNKKKNEPKGKTDEATVLNNGKPVCTNKPHSVSHKKADYINNDLRDPRKRTNQNTASTNNPEEKIFSETVAPNGTSVHCNADKSKPHSSSNTTQKRETTTGNKRAKKCPNVDWEAIDEYVNNVAEKIKNTVKHIFSLLITLLLYICGVFMYVVFWCVHIIGVVGVSIWNWCSCKLFNNKMSSNQKSNEPSKRQIGLDENIVLPTTGEEAMKRLLSCKGKDPYSILGLKSDASDEDVKKYYRKQAVLVHPDKNQELGAEESFKILGHAFEMIGEPTKRLQFDAKSREEADTETAMKDFTDLLTKLQEKIQEAANLMRCDNCNGKHKRTPINRQWYSARYCDKCNIHHSAKEGDVWAETSMLGFLWNYYAIMDGNVYDITEWVACHKNFFKHMTANSHSVLYRIATDGNKNHRSQHGQSREAELEDFINQLFSKANMTADGAGPSSPWQQPQQKSQQSTSSQWNSSSGGKKSRKKKKRH